MNDERAQQLAELVCDYSISLQKGDRLVLQYDPSFRDYAELFIQQAKKRGANFYLDELSFDPKHLRGLVERLDDTELEKELARRKGFASWCNTRVLIDCNSDNNFARGLPDASSRIGELDKRVIGPYKKVLYRPGSYKGYEIKWNIVGFPCKEGAVTAGMSLDEYSNFVYSATLGNNWQKMSQEMQIIKSTFDKAKNVHLFVPGLTDLHLSLADRGGEICDGKLNMPDGEVCYGPVENSANGTILFQTPTKRAGMDILQGIKLRFVNGTIVEHSAKKNQQALDEVLKIDEGVKRIGELGIGCNYAIKKAILEVLFDEKIGGTFHLALGSSLSPHLLEGGGLNDSAIHWDIVCDLRRNETNLSDFPGGEVRVDGKMVQKDGKWLF